MRNFFKKFFNYQPDDFTTREKSHSTDSLPLSAGECSYDVKWSEEDQSFVATVAEFPSLSWIDETPDKALGGLRRVVTDTLNEVTD